MHSLNLRGRIAVVVLGSIVSLGALSSAQALSSEVGLNFGKSVNLIATASIDSAFTSAAKPVIQIDDEAPGEPYVGETLDAKTNYFGGWDPTPTRMTYTWLADGKAIKKANSASYTLTSRDVGKSITVRVVGSRASYVTTTKVSDATAAVSAGQAFATASTPTLTGTASVGQVLGSEVAPWSAPGQIVMYYYQWLRSGKAVKGATNYTYQLTSKDAGKTMSVRWTGWAPTYLNTVRTSLSTAPVTRGD
jgi:hypothetical protein